MWEIPTAKPAPPGQVVLQERAPQVFKGKGVKMADFKEIDNARKTLGLDEEASMEDIKKAYKKLALKYHPDKCKDELKRECEEMFKTIAHAKDILMTYCTGYRCSFKEKDVKRNAMDKQFYEHLKRFYDGWIDDLDL